MTDRVARKLHFTPKLLLRVAGWLTFAAVALFVLVAAAQSRAQSPTDSKTQSIAGLPGFGLRGLGALTVHNSSMSDFAGMMQETVMDRPVIDQTGLPGRYDFNLNWTPDDSQFGGMGGKIPPPADNTNPPPNLYTAIQEQIGLKLDATKAPTDVMVVDHVEKPSEN